MKKSIMNSMFFAVLVFFSSNVFAWNTSTVNTSKHTIGYAEVEVQFYRHFRPKSIMYPDKEKVNWVIFNPKHYNDVEFWVDDPKYVGAFSLIDVSQHESRGGGFIFEMTEANYDQTAWYWAPYPQTDKDSDALMNFNSWYSYRIMLSRTLDDGKLSACHPIEFEIEGTGPWVVEPGLDSNGHNMIGLDNKKVAHIPGLQKCAEPMCTDLGFDVNTKKECPYIN